MQSSFLDKIQWECLLTRLPLSKKDKKTTLSNSNNSKNNYDTNQRARKAARADEDEQSFSL